MPVDVAAALDRVAAEIVPGDSWKQALRAATVIAVVGSREYPDLMRVVKFMDQVPRGAVLVSGGARGVDATARDAAIRQDMAVVEFKPVSVFGRKDLFARAAIARDFWFGIIADFTVAFWDGQSNGTKATIEGALTVGECIVALPGHKPQSWTRRGRGV